MAEAGTQPAESPRGARTGSFGAPTPKQEEPEEQQNGAPPGGPRQPFGAPPVTSDWQTNSAAKGERRGASSGRGPEQRVGVVGRGAVPAHPRARKLLLTNRAAQTEEADGAVESMRAALPREITSNDPLDPGLSIDARR